VGLLVDLSLPQRCDSVARLHTAEKNYWPWPSVDTKEKGWRFNAVHYRFFSGCLLDWYFGGLWFGGLTIQEAGPAFQRDGQGSWQPASSEQSLSEDLQVAESEAHRKNGGRGA